MEKTAVKISKSKRIFLRREKARIRKTVASIEEQKEMIKKLYEPDSNENK